jgi:lysophospholipid acyltransferase (LPLAT)-like uncharacterized protein
MSGSSHASASRIATVAVFLMRVWFRTLRFRFTDHAGVMRQPPETPLLWTFWHNRLFVMAYMFERYFPGRPGAALASASKDGEIIAQIMQRFTIRPIRGSSSRRGAAALVEMKRAIEKGLIMAITPDGPRGPRYHVNPGVIKLAQITQGHILPIHVTYRRFWRLRSWDGFLLPKPFSTIDIVFDRLHPVEPTATPEDFERERLAFEARLRPEGWEAELAQTGATPAEAQPA